MVGNMGHLMSRIDQHFYQQVNRTPDRWALSAGNVRWRYYELGEAVAKRAKELEQLGVEFGDVVCLLMPNCMEWIRDALAVLCLGGIIMPLHPDLTEDERRKLFTTIQPDWILQPTVERMISAKRTHVPEGAFFLGFTSGSTGTPKGLVKTHQSWTCCFDGWSLAFSLTKDDRVLLPLHMSYSAQLYPAIHGLCSGAEVILLPHFSPGGLFEAQATCVSVTPALIEPLVRFQERLRNKGRQVIPPTVVISVGTKLTAAQRIRFETCFPECELYEYYGSSEMGYVTLLTPQDAREAPETVGYPFPGVEVAFFNEKADLLPSGAPGKLYVRSDQAFTEYVGMPEETRTAFIGEWVTSHDIGFQRADGRIMLLGRDRDVIKSGGSLVYAGEVEEILMSIDGVLDAAVVSGPDPIRGEVVWAAVVLTHETKLADIQKSCSERLAPFKRPRKWAVFNELPKNRNGKVDKGETRLMMRGKLHDLQIGL